MGSTLQSALSGAVVPLHGTIASSAPRNRPGPLCRIRRAGRYLLGLIALYAVALLAPAAGAHETDQSTLPLGREFADLKIPLSHMVQAAIVEAVNQTNRAIQHSLLAR